MAAYAALVSLMNTMEQIQNHPSLSNCINMNQIESLGEKVSFLLDFVEIYNSYSGSHEDLWSQIVSAAEAAEDVIESHIGDQIHAIFCQRIDGWLLDLQSVIADVDSIKERVMEVKENWGFKEEKPCYLKSSSSSSSSSALPTGKTTMVGFEDELIRLVDFLTGQQSDRRVVSIVGMGGMGKTTLTRNIYENSIIVHHFDVCAWATISQEYSVREILLELISCKEESFSGSDDELGERLYRSLCGRRYLIILDDIWSIELWDKINVFFPNNGNSSRVVVTTRLSNVAGYCGSFCFKMNFLSEDKCWELFCERVFGHEVCPLELEEIGKGIVGLCKGLPLSIVVVGGLLKKSYRTRRSWLNVAENINSIINLGENGRCLNVLFLSYNHLPAYLKPCFLYMGSFKDDSEIRVSQIIRLWVAEGFIKRNNAQILEEIAEGYLKELVERNLISVGRCRKNGKIRTCRIHDLLRDLCISVAEKEKFFCIVAKGNNIPQGMEKQRRLVCHDNILKHRDSQLFHVMQSALSARSLICRVVENPARYRSMRVLNTFTIWFSDGLFENFNLRFLTYNPWDTAFKFEYDFHASLSLIWNLQTLIAKRPELIVAPLEIWKMRQLRHVQCNKIYLPYPPPSDEQGSLLVLENLQTLSRVVNFRLTEDVCKRISYIKKLHLIYDHNFMGYADCWYDYLPNLGRLHKLESLRIKFLFYAKVSCWSSLLITLGLKFRCLLRLRFRCSKKESDTIPSPLKKLYLQNKNLTFPNSLNKLSLKNCGLHWDDLRIIGLLPQLEVLNLKTIVGKEWIPTEGEFLRLKFLSINNCDLTSWNADSSHFPVLEKLLLKRSWGLNEIPWGIGEIPTLELIRLVHCGESAIISAMKIKEEQASLGNDGLHIQAMIIPSFIESFMEKVEMERLSVNNIQLEVGHLPNFEKRLD